jgi:putative phage-type endonuclease
MFLTALLRCSVFRQMRGVNFIYRDLAESTRAVRCRVLPLSEIETKSIDPRVLDLFKRQQSLQAAETGSSAWLKERSQRISGSEIAALIGKTPYLSALKYFKQKSGQIKRDVPNQYMVAHGNKFELEAACVYSAITGRSLILDNPGSVTHPSFEWLAATPDFITVDGLLIEIKCPKTRKITHEIPRHYYPQVQLQLHVCQLEYCHFVQYKPPTLFESGELDILEIKRCPQWFEMVFPIAHAFHKDLLLFKTNPKKAIEIHDRVTKASSFARKTVPDWQSTMTTKTSKVGCVSVGPSRPICTDKSPFVSVPGEITISHSLLVCQDDE